MEDHRICLVCSTLITSTHLGMDICRAYASFFKRARKIGVEYPCRQGTRQCSVSQENKFICRRCRYDKCLSIGVIYDGPMRIRARPVKALLHRIEKEFKSLIERRRTKELEFMRSVTQSGVVSHPREKIYMVNANASIDLHMIAISESRVFFENTFPSLMNLPRQDIDNIFHEYIIKLGLVISYYLTRKLWGDVRKKLMSSIITCYDSEIPIDFYYPEFDGNKTFFESSIRSHSEDHATIFLPLFERAQITEQEFHALAALVLTEHDLSISEEAEQIMDDIRHEIFENLQSYYQKEMRLTDFSERFGNLMTLNHTIQ
ncbi:hypothetical protein PENTCL1PPCAC_17160, partial [Pristionchus entomophagus]